jgi:hypothetical protein
MHVTEVHVLHLLAAFAEGYVDIPFLAGHGAQP